MWPLWVWVTIVASIIAVAVIITVILLVINADNAASSLTSGSTSPSTSSTATSASSLVPSGTSASSLIPGTPQFPNDFGIYGIYNVGGVASMFAAPESSPTLLTILTNFSDPRQRFQMRFLGDSSDPTRKLYALLSPAISLTAEAYPLNVGFSPWFNANEQFELIYLGPAAAPYVGSFMYGINFLPYISALTGTGQNGQVGYSDYDWFQNTNQQWVFFAIA